MKITSGRILLIIGGLLLAFLFIWLGANLGLFSSNGQIYISKQTTWLTDGPLKSNGDVDYVAWMNQVDSKNVLPEENAMVDILEIYGPSDFPTAKEYRTEFFEKLGIDPIPESGNYLTKIGDFNPSSSNANAPIPANASQPNQLLVNFDESKQVMWGANDFPDLASWLSLHESHIDRLVEGSKKRFLYEPSIGEDCYSILLPGTQLVRNVAHCLLTRAMFRLNSGDKSGCIEDLLAARCIGNLAGGRSLLISNLVSIAIHQWVVHAELEMCKSGKLSSQELLDYRDVINKLHRKVDIAKSISKGERILMLDLMQSASRKGISDSINAFGGEISVTHSLAMPTSATDFNEGMKTINRWFDNVELILAIEDARKRKTAWQQFQVDLEDVERNASDSWSLLTTAISGRTAKGRKIGDIFVVLGMPSLLQCDLAYETATNLQNTILVMLSLSAYKADNGKYPNSLTKLVPKYLPFIPIDTMSGNPFIYDTDGNYATVYSIGQNGKDDKGEILDNAFTGDSGLTTKVTPDVMIEEK